VKVTVLVKEIRADYLPYTLHKINKFIQNLQLMLYENKYI